jgi:hypothetical protein
VPANQVADTPMNLSATATDPGGASDTLTYTWTLLPPLGVPIILTGANVTFTPAYQGNYDIRLGVTDRDGAQAFSDPVALVQDAALTAGNLTPPTAPEGQTFSNVTVFHFTDADPSAIPSDYAATVNTGDTTLSSTANPSSVQIVAGNGGFDVQLSYTYAEELTSQTFSVSVNDVGGASTSASTSSFSVADAALTITSMTHPAATESFSTGTVTVASFTDAAGVYSDINDLSATITWADGQTSSGTVLAGSTPGSYTVTGRHTYAEEIVTPANFSVTVKDSGGASASKTISTATVADAVLTITSVTHPAATEGISTGIVTVAAFTDAAGSSSDIKDLSATITWADGSTSAGTVVATGTPGSYTVTGSHIYAEEINTPASFSVAVEDSGGGSASQSIATATVADAGLTLPATGVAINQSEGTSFSGAVATFTDANPNGQVADFTATIDWGDGTMTSGSVTADGSAGFNVTGIHVYAEEGSNTVTVNIRDAGGSAATATGTITVTEPALSGVGVAIQGFERSSLDKVVVARFTHGPGGEPPSSFVARIDWGDGISSPGTVTLSNTTYSVSGSHVYSEEGPFAVTVTVADVGSEPTTVIHTNAGIMEELLPDGTRGSANQRFISELYRDLLKRAVEPLGLAFWNDKLNKGASQSDIVAGIEVSNEYRTDLIQSLYQLYLHRDADPTGFQSSFNLLANGGTAEQLAAVVAGSQEYFKTRAGGTNVGFLNAIYADALGRSASGSDRAGWDLELTGAMSRREVALAILSSNEYRRDFGARAYQQFLDRPASETEVENVARLLRSQRDEELLRFIMASDEFFAKASM